MARTEFEALHSFQSEMWKKLKANAHKGGWAKESVLTLLRRAEDELGELRSAVDAGESPERIASECADVANFVMMVADVVGGLKYERG